MVTNLEVTIPVPEATPAAPQTAGPQTHADKGFRQVFAAHQKAVDKDDATPNSPREASGSPAVQEAPTPPEEPEAEPDATKAEAPDPDRSLTTLLASLWLPGQEPTTPQSALTTARAGLGKDADGSQLLSVPGFPPGWRLRGSASEPEAVPSVPALVNGLLAAPVATAALAGNMANAEPVVLADGHPLASSGDASGGTIRPAVAAEAASALVPGGTPSAAVPPVIPAPLPPRDPTPSADAAELPATDAATAPLVAEATLSGQTPPLRHARTAILATDDGAALEVAPAAWQAPAAVNASLSPALPAAPPVIASERSRLQVSATGDAVAVGQTESATLASRSPEQVAGPQSALVPLVSQHATPTAGPPPLPNPVERLVAYQVTRALVRRPDGGGDRSLTIRLTPPELGTVRVEIQERDGQFTARLHADDPAVRQALERVLPQMRSELRLGDSAVHQISVAAGNAPDQGFDGRGFDGRGGSPQSDGGRHPGRQRRGDRPAFTLDHDVGAIGEVATAATRPRVASGLVDALA